MWLWGPNPPPKPHSCPLGSASGLGWLEGLSVELGAPSVELGALNVELGALNVGFGCLSVGLGFLNVGLGCASVGFGCLSVGFGCVSVGVGCGVRWRVGRIWSRGGRRRVARS
ncbi:hypothetical protein JOM49_000561 [Amycolatopsis magusensis]|uniref:Uncharacterized protein n=1 Tax=Amycolatopsis magusensis TaxID=882444 RepID=A0ABS4PI28_9PSEU|nr:hypothetical protein [Amycolatopsis magusensis]